MVSNDFTQVLSDGIGAYVVNNARTELARVYILLPVDILKMAG